MSFLVYFRPPEGGLFYDVKEFYMSLYFCRAVLSIEKKVQIVSEFTIQIFQQFMVWNTVFFAAE